MTANYDLIIIGGGPAGLTAALYAARARLNTLVIEKDAYGGRMVNADLVENFPGFPQGISGGDLTASLMAQVMKYEVEFKLTEVQGIEPRREVKWVRAAEGNYSARAIIIAGGAKPKKLGIPGEEKFSGDAVFYCAMCEGNRFQDREVAVIGGGDGGITEGLYLSRIASRVTVVEILPTIQATSVLLENARTNLKMEIRCSTTVEEIRGGRGGKKTLYLKNVGTGEKSTLKVSAVFILVGVEPQTEYLGGVLDLDPSGYISVNQNLETSLPGVFAAGDIRSGSPRQAITAAGDGAAAALAAERFISTLQSTPDLSELDF